MKTVNLRDLYPDVYKTDAFLEVTDEVQAVFQSDERAEAAYERKMYRYKAQYSLDCENGIENAVLRKLETPVQKSASQPHLHAVWAPPCRSFSPTFTL